MWRGEVWLAAVAPKGWSNAAKTVRAPQLEGDTSWSADATDASANGDHASSFSCGGTYFGHTHV